MPNGEWGSHYFAGPGRVKLAYKRPSPAKLGEENDNIYSLPVCIRLFLIRTNTIYTMIPTCRAGHLQSKIEDSLLAIQYGIEYSQPAPELLITVGLTPCAQFDTAEGGARRQSDSRYRAL